MEVETHDIEPPPPPPKEKMSKVEDHIPDRISDVPSWDVEIIF